MDVKLSVQSGGRHDRSIPIGDGDFVIGRDLSCHFRGDHDRVGHQHCRIRQGGGKVVVEDLNSIHGTHVNDQAIRRHEARDGDRLRIGPMTFVFQIAAPGADAKGRPGARAAAEAERLMPRAVSRNPLDSNFESPATLSARNLLARLTGQPGAGDLQTGLRIVDHGGIAVVRPIEESIVEDEAVRRIAHELDGLIDAGRDRIVLNLEVVENLSIQAVGMIVEVRDRCAAAGGLLKLCRLSPPLARALTLMHLDGQFAVTHDEADALEGPWTAPSGAAPAPAAAQAAGPRLRLVALLGRARGKAIEVSRAKFVIGRDPSCHLRPNSPAISRLHTVLEQRGGRVRVRDLGAKNGTLLNGRLLRGEEAEIAHGDRLQIGPLLFVVALEDREVALGPEVGGDTGDSWMIGAAGPTAPEARPTPDPGEAPGSDSTLLVELPPGGFEAPPPPPEPHRPPASAAAPIKDLAYQVLDGALLVTILTSDLNDEPEVGPVRYELCTLLEQEALPRRVVISLERVRYLSSRAVGVLLAHYQRLSRLGGTMRLCHVAPNLVRVLDQMRLPMLIDVYPTAAEALRDPWG